MKKINSTFVAVAMIGSMLIGTSAVAQTGVYSGQATVSQGLTLNCNVSVDFNSSPGRVVFSISSGETLCSSIGINSNPHEYTLNGTNLTVFGVSVTSVTGGCTGDLVGTLNASGITANATLRGSGLFGNCRITTIGALTN